MGPGQQLFDLSLLEQMSDKSFIKEVINLYLHDTALDISEMKNAFASGDLETVYKKAHKMKSSTGMLKADTLYNLLADIEQNAKANTGSGLLPKMIEGAAHTFHLLQASLVAHLQEAEMMA